MLTRIRTNLNKFLQWTLIVIMVVMVMNVLWQVFTRFVLKRPSSYTEELARFLLIWISLLGACYVCGKNSHLSIDIIKTKLSPQKLLYLELVKNSLIFTFAFSVLLIGGIRLIIVNLKLNQISAALQMKMGYVYLVIPISGIIIMLYMVIDMMDNISKLKKGKMNGTP